MYPVRLGIKTAKNRINKLIKNGHHAEALLTSVFTYEKTIHRTLKQLMVSAGLRSKDANSLLDNIQGFYRQTQIWSCFDPQNKKLTEILDNKYWQHIKKAVKMRNELVHGAKAYKLDECKEMAKKVLALTDHTIDSFKEIYGFDGWEKVAIRKISRLHTDPKIKTASK